MVLLEVSMGVVDLEESDLTGLGSGFRASGALAGFQRFRGADGSEGNGCQGLASRDRQTVSCSRLHATTYRV